MRAKIEKMNLTVFLWLLKKDDTKKDPILVRYGRIIILYEHLSLSHLISGIRLINSL
jgi:hypothetical protein